MTASRLWYYSMNRTPTHTQAISDILRIMPGSNSPELLLRASAAASEQYVHLQTLIAPPADFDLSGPPQLDMHQYSHLVKCTSCGMHGEKTPVGVNGKRMSTFLNPGADGSMLHDFVDASFIEHSWGVVRVSTPPLNRTLLHRLTGPGKRCLRNPPPGLPAWQRYVGAPLHVDHDGSSFRMWLVGYHNGCGGPAQQDTTMRTSEDGIHWSSTYSRMRIRSGLDANAQRRRARLGVQMSISKLNHCPSVSTRPRRGTAYVATFWSRHK